MSEFNQTKYIQKYKKEKYSRAVIDFKKEEKDIITNHWKSKGYNSFTEYIKELIQKDMSQTSYISVGDITQEGDNNTINIGK